MYVEKSIAKYSSNMHEDMDLRTSQVFGKIKDLKALKNVSEFKR